MRRRLRPRASGLGLGGHGQAQLPLRVGRARLGLRRVHQEREAGAELVEHLLERRAFDPLADLRRDRLEHRHDLVDVVGQRGHELVARPRALEARVARELVGRKEAFHRRSSGVTA
jgi:hypothetical protein